jgi:hypothetical protein
VDGVDCAIQEPWPYERRKKKDYYSKKENGAGVRYDIGIYIQTGDIVWVNGPFKCGSWPDLLIYRRDLKQKLRAGEMAEADSGYRGDTMIRNADVFFLRSDLREKEVARARHETVNRRFKQFNFLQ